MLTGVCVWGAVNVRLTQAFTSMHFSELILHHGQEKLDEGVEETSGLTKGSREEERPRVTCT